MKKFERIKKNSKRYEFDEETLRRWKNTSTKAKLKWLEDSLKFFGGGK